jgi:hypothetical protein
MRSHFRTRLPNRKARAASPLRARCAVAAIALLTCAVAHAAPLPSPPQQLTVAFTNAFPNGSVNSLTMPSPSSAAIAATNPLLTGGTPQNIYTALTWVTNPVTSTLDLIYADAEQHKIWRLPGPSYQTPTAIFSWSRKGSGPPYPVGLAADTAGNVYAISPSSAWDNPGVWVIPFIATGASAGGYGAPLLIDNTFQDPITHKPTTTLALAEVAVAAGGASSVGSTTPAWNALDLLVLVGDTFNTRVIRYSLSQIESVLSSHGSFQGPASTVVTQTQFLTQAVLKIPPVVVGMDMARDPNTQDVTLLFSTLGGRILDFDSAKSAFITPYAINLGLGLTRLKVGTFQGVQYVFVGQLPGAILEFAAPPPGTSDTKAFAIVTKGVNNPADLAVTNSGSTLAGSCVTASGCSILPQLSLQITGPGTVNIPPNAPIVVDSCAIAADPRVMMTDGAPTYNFVPLNLGTFCPSLANVLLSANVFGGSGPTGTGMNVAKITSGLNQYEIINNTPTTPINNTLTAFTLNPGMVLGNTPLCGSLNGPVAAWGPLPESESMIPEGTLIDITVACTSDPPPAGKGNHPSVLIEGTVVAGLNAAYIVSEFNSLQQAFNQIQAPQVQPPTTQIVDPTNTVVPTIQGYITTSLGYFTQPQPNYPCALNTLATAARYVNSTVMANPGDFIAGPPPFDDENPSGTLMMRFDHLYYDVNIVAGNAPITTDALNPATVVPTCATTSPPTISGFTVVYANEDGTAGSPNFDGTGFDLFAGTAYYLEWTTTNMAPGAQCSLTTTDGAYTGASEPLNSAFSDGTSPAPFTDTVVNSETYQTATLTCGTTAGSVTSTFQYLVNEIIP